ncbi:hypothetical protein FQN60_005318 [Etheostoma spectabile]|uniref:Cationic amino acid transporter C-terminal domain-containing protein n=1 Tax=Etheostoma spectabile TaxID=54343 RepID=A0A5J5C965_9PERO|nr:hypothetical protein FQN60_005318 [Etheostoma spectabile]
MLSTLTCVQVSVVLTLMVPYDLIDGSAPLMEMFAVHGFLWGKYTVAVGSVAGLTVSLLGLRDLIEMMSIGTLLAYTLVSVCVLLLRYQPDEDADQFVVSGEDEDEDGPKHRQDDGAAPTKDDQVLIGGPDADGSGSYHAGGTEGEGEDSEFHTGHASLLKRLLGGHFYTLRLRLGLPDPSARPTPATGRTVTRCTLLFFLTSFFLWSTVIFGVEQGRGAGAVVSGLAATLMGGSLAKLLVLILQQPQSARKLPYMAPCVPFVPAAAILVNSYLMLKLSSLTWARFTIWCFIGLLIYGCYGVWHSTLELTAREQQAHASSYQRYEDHLDDETTFSPDDNGGPGQREETPYQGWSAPEERGHNYRDVQDDGGDGDQQPGRWEDDGDPSGDRSGYRSGYQSGYQSGPAGPAASRGRTNQGFDEEED